MKLEEFKKPEVEEWFYHLVQYPASFTSGVGVSVSLKGDIRLITDAFLFFPSIIGDAPLRWATTDVFRYGAR